MNRQQQQQPQQQYEDISVTNSIKSENDNSIGGGPSMTSYPVESVEQQPSSQDHHQSRQYQGNSSNYNNDNDNRYTGTVNSNHSISSTDTDRRRRVRMEREKAREKALLLELSDTKRYRNLGNSANGHGNATSHSSDASNNDDHASTYSKTSSRVMLRPSSSNGFSKPTFGGDNNTNSGGDNSSNSNSSSTRATSNSNISKSEYERAKNRLISQKQQFKHQ